MPEHNERHDDTDEVVRRNVEQAKELLAKRHQEEQERQAEPPLTDDTGNENSVRYPGQDSIPMGGTTGSGQNLGGGFRSGRNRHGG
jgi:hypothetical protein